VIHLYFVLFILLHIFYVFICFLNVFQDKIHTLINCLKGGSVKKSGIKKIKECDH
jgi:hypothetical protein